MSLQKRKLLFRAFLIVFAPAILAWALIVLGGAFAIAGSILVGGAWIIDALGHLCWLMATGVLNATFGCIHAILDATGKTIWWVYMIIPAVLSVVFLVVISIKKKAE